MKRQAIEEYLDGALDAASRSSVEKAVAQDAQAGRMLADCQAERALREAVYASYAPSKQEASAFAAQVMAACEDDAAQPVGRIGVWTWTRRLTGIAAAVVVMAGMFVAGRSTAPTKVVEVQGPEVVRTITKVVKIGQGDTFVARDFSPSEADEMNNFINGDTNGSSNMATLDLSTSGYFDPGHL